MTQKTYYHIILDQSGSMQSCLRPTISGFNEQLNVIRDLQQRYPEQEIRVGLTRFHQEVLHTYYAQHPDKVADLDHTIYKPNGTTALYDAIGESVKKLYKQIKLELISGLATAIVVIITDGYENASSQYDQDQIKELIKELESTGKWTFSYLGATLDAVEIATSMNIKQQNSMAFDKSNIEGVFFKLADSMHAYQQQKRKGDNPIDFLKSQD